MADPPASAPSDALLLQQELSRTEYYRMERAQRSLQLFDQAVKYNVPPALIPLLFAQTDPPQHITSELDKLAQDAPVSLTSYSALVQAAAQAAANVLTSSAAIPVAQQPTAYPSSHSTPSHAGTPGVSISAQAGAIAAAAAQGVVPGTPQRQPHESARLMSPLHKDSRMSFRHHQRNLSMPSKPSDYGAQSPRRYQFGPAVHPMQHLQQPVQPQLHPSPPIYSNSPHAQQTHTSPVRGPAGPWPYYAPGVAAGTPGASTPGVVGTPVGPPGSQGPPPGLPGTPSGAPAGSPPSSPQPVAPPSQSMHHIIQFHHWQPTRTPSNTKKEKEQKEKQERERRGDRKDKERDEDEESGGGRKRRRSDAAGPSRAESTAPERERERERGAERAARGSRGSDASSNADAAESATASSSTTAIANAASLSNRRKTHTRHRSETSIRSDSFNRSLNYFQSGGSGAGPAGSELTSLSIPEYPYKTDAVSSERTTPNPQAKSHKHGVDFMIDKEK
ncbi:hypothetical protein CJU90_5667 [Yarrowia sp. C11]|nr:hypothetical protein CJU90_5667 [Yarrowia sp. C11]KAG5364252.1 hypothetical protein CKK34_3045 [Yarrowia sp. E02]